MELRRMPRKSSGQILSGTLIALGLSLLGGCAWAPGQHLGADSRTDGSIDTTGEVQGLKVRLRSLTPKVTTEFREAGRKPVAVPKEFAEVKSGPYRLGLYDVVTVTVWEHPELSMPLGQYRADLAAGQMLDESGNIFYPYVGYLPAKDMTANELRERILKALSKVLNNPQLDVKITGFRSQKIFVHGGVTKPGAVPVTDVPLTLLDAVNQAGGLSPNGDPTQVELKRSGKTLTLDLYADYGAGVDPSRLVLQNGDVVRIPTRDELQAYVLGEVERPQALGFANGKLSLAQAIAQVGGLDKLSSKGKGVYVARLSDSASVELYHLDARNPLALVVGDQFPLKPRDIVWVDATGLARWNRVLSLLAPTAGLYNTLVSSANNTIDLIP